MPVSSVGFFVTALAGIVCVGSVLVFSLVKFQDDQRSKLLKNGDVVIDIEIVD